jgi:hypothetical protein
VRRSHRRIRRTRGGVFELTIPEVERRILRSLPGQLRELLASDDPALGRLFPPAYPDEPDRNTEYDQMVRGDLESQRLSSLDTMEATIDAEHLDEDQLVAWLGAINDLRLVLGTRLDVTEDEPEVDDADPRAPSYALYYYLGWLEEQAVEALAEGIDPAGSR